MSHAHEKYPDAPNAAAFAIRLQSLIPTLETERLRLRAPALADFPVYADIALGPKGRFILPEQTRAGAWYDFSNMVACWLLRGHGLWTVERRDTALTLGFTLISFEPGDHEPELGYMFAAEAEGNGYATEAAGRAKLYAFETLAFSTLVSTIDPDNAASLAVALRLGGARDTDAEAAHGGETLVVRYAAAED